MARIRFDSHMVINLLLYVVFLMVYDLHSQRKGILKHQQQLDATTFYGADSFGAIYYSKGNILYKKWRGKELRFGDYALGQLSSVSLTNPLKILLFYQTSNTVVLIDKYFNEIDRIDFNLLPDLKIVKYASIANDAGIWIFNTNIQRLELFDRTTLKTVWSSQPLSKLPNYMHSTFTSCWLLETERILHFNLYGTLVEAFKVEDFENLHIDSRRITLRKANELFDFDVKTNKIERIKLPEISIEQFYITDENLYIYSKGQLFCYQLTPLKN